MLPNIIIIIIINGEFYGFDNMFLVCCDTITTRTSVYRGCRIDRSLQRAVMSIASLATVYNMSRCTRTGTIITVATTVAFNQTRSRDALGRLACGYMPPGSQAGKSESHVHGACCLPVFDPFDTSPSPRVFTRYKPKTFRPAATAAAAATGTRRFLET